MDPTLAPAAVVAERKTESERAILAQHVTALYRAIRAPPVSRSPLPSPLFPSEQAMMNPYNGMYPGYMVRVRSVAATLPRASALPARSEIALARSEATTGEKNIFSLFSDRSPPPLSLSLLLSQGAGYGAANAGADASAAVKAEAGKTGFDPAQLAQWQQTVAAQQRAQSGAAAAQTAAVASKAGGVGGVTNGTNGAPEMWMDERELKRQRRKQSNRESARRSRLRKQAECEELGGRVDALSTENITLRAELKRLKDACGSLETDNKTLADKLKVIKGDDVEAAAEGGKKTSPTKGGESRGRGWREGLNESTIDRSIVRLIVLPRDDDRRH